MGARPGWSRYGRAVSPIPGGGYVVIGNAVGNGGSDDIWFTQLSASLSCQNIGLGDAGGFTVKIYFSRKTTISRKSTLIKTQTVSSLAAGGSVPISIKATPAQKHRYLVAVVDSAGTVGESNETNNSVVGSLP